MRKIVLSAGFYVILALALTLWFGFSSQEIVAQPDVNAPFVEEWSSSGHADAKAEAFRHWDAEDPKQVPERCAACHSSTGYLDFIGADDSEAGKVDKPAPVDTVVDCAACHNDVTLKMDSVVMPSGVEISGLGREARCMVCHQGRASKVSVDGAIEKAEVADVDTVSDKLGFINIHYFAAAATKYGTIAKGGYEYEGKTYDAELAHIAGYESCVDCHNAHTLEVKVSECRTCHIDVKKVEDLKNLRLQGSAEDYDGDGNLEEGIAAEIEGLQAVLYQAIQAYAREKVGKPIGYESHSHPYFFNDANNDGTIDEAEVEAEDGRYTSWTARLLKAAYNYQVSMKDPGAYAHGGKYIIQLLYDSVEDVNAALSAQISLEKAHRIDDGHFAGSEEAFRHWDEEGEVPRDCSKCHSSTGLPRFLKDNTTISEPLSNGLQCSTCHNDLVNYSVYEVAKVNFPSGKMITSEDPTTNLCMNCHQGRESTYSVEKLTRASRGNRYDDTILDDELDTSHEDAVSDKLRFLNVHYFAAGATKYGTEAKGGYEYDGKEYVGLFNHVPNFAGCTSCHNTHGLKVKEDTCTMCHPQAKDNGIHAIRMTSPDYDGDGNTTEGVAEELETLEQALYAAIQEYAKNVVKVALVYDSSSYPYFFNDTNGNGQPDPDEAIRANGYNTWTPKLLEAAYNYQYVAKDPGGFAHNPKYIAQLLYDSLDSLGARQDTMVRP